MVQGQPPKRRKCRHCGAVLSRYNPGKLCLPCKDVAPNPCGEKIVDLAKELLKEPQRWGLIGVEYIFFHQFFNQELQLELKEMRRQLYGQEDPPMPMTLREAEQAFSRYEGPTLDELKETVEAKALWADFGNLADQIVSLSSSIDRQELRGLLNETLALGETLRARERWIKSIKKALMPLAFLKASKDRLLTTVRELQSKGLFGGSSEPVSLRLSLGILASPIADREGPDKAGVFWQVAKRLDQLETELPTYGGSLHTALVCGTPPVTPNITFQLELVPSGPVPTVLRIRIFSAKVRDISGLYEATVQELLGLRPRKHSATACPDPEAEWIEEGPLPHLKISVFLRPASIPTASYVQRVLRKEAAGRPFYDRGTKVFDIEKRIRTWATASLRLVCDMGNRDALRFWDAHCTDDRLRYGFERKRAQYTFTVPQEVQLQQDVDHVRQRLATMARPLIP